MLKYPEHLCAGSVSDKSGTGALLFGTTPTITNPVITNIAPSADFTLTQNAVAPFTSVNTGAVANTLYLKTGSVGIGTNNPAASAVLDISSTTKGLLLPRMSTAQRTAIATPSAGLQVFDTDQFNIYFHNGSSWQAVGTSTATGLANLNGLTGGTQGFANGLTGTAPAFSSSGTTHTLNIPLASGAGVTAGLLSKTDYDAFNTKQGALSNSAGLASALSDETGTGFAVFSASPTLTGVPAAPTAAANTNTTQLATTAFVMNQVATVAPLIDGTAAVGTSLLYARQDHVHPTDTTRSPLAGSSSITTLGTITSGTWTGTTIAIANGGTGATTQAAAQTALGITSAGLTATGNIAGNIPLVGTGGIVANNLCAGASSGGGISCAIANTSAGIAGLISDETGSGLLVFGTTPTITNPVITNIAPAADFTLTQNAVLPFTSVNIGAIANTLTLKTGQVGIGTVTPVTTAALDITSTTKGLLIPRMTTVQRTAITTPAAGLQVYDTDLNSLYFHNGTAWQAVGVAGSGITNLNGLTSSSQSFAVGTTGTAPIFSSGTSTHTLNIPLASGAGVTAGLLSKTDYDAFNTKQGALSNSAGLASALSDETGTGFAVFSASPTLTGVPAAPTAAANTNTTQIATTAFVMGQVNTKENTITAGSTAQYLRGDKSLSTFASDIWATVLTGLSTATNSAISAADSILVAFGKLQAQVSAHTTSIGNKADVTNGSQTITASSVVAVSVTGLNAPTLGADAANKTYVDGVRGFVYQSVSANYSVLTTDNGKFFATTNGPTITLPGVATVPSGFQVTVKQTDASTATIATTSSQTIDGATTVALPSQYAVYAFVNTGSQWLIASKYGLNPAVLALSPTSLSGLNATAPTDGSCQNTTVTNSGQIASSAITVTAPTGFSKTGCTDTCSGATLAGGASCTVGVKALGSIALGAVSGNLAVSATSGGNLTSALTGTVTDICASTSTAGTACFGGAIYLGSLSPGATGGSGTNKYMTTPGGCGEIPAGQKSAGINTPGGDYPNADFTPTCSGTDSLTKYWNDGSTNWAVVAGLTDYTTTAGTGNGAINTDLNYGSTNTTNIATVTAAGSGGYHAAARYCDRLNYGGYTDWYLPNRYELNLMWTNVASIPGLDTIGSWYWSSTEYYNSSAWVERFNDGYESNNGKNILYRVRCVRRF